MTKVTTNLEEALPEAPPATAIAAVRNAYTRKVAEQQEVACLMLFVQNYNMHGMGKTIPELHAMLKLTKKGIPKKTPTVLAIRKGQIQIPKSQARELKKNKASASGTSGIFTIELFSFPKSNTWIYDTGCGNHISNTIRGLRGYQKLNKGALDLYVGNGHSASVEAIRSFKLILPSGMILVLDNMQSVKDNQVWNLVDLPPNCKTVGSKWLFKKKTNMDGNIHTYKDCLIAKGFTQTYGVEYEETFSPVADIKAN
ncbi:putative retrotransposon ty1-copia subclass protein [Tanacetum coccineum]